MNTTYLGRFIRLSEFEEAVILSICKLGKMAYGLRITELLESEARLPISIAKVHVTLSKLERNGILTSELGEPTLELCGSSKRIYSICDSSIGSKAVDEWKEREVELIHTTAEDWVKIW
jgi:DNA-binding PadR family transcriptional regulator